jgi:iron complex outermembrane receptor protein
MKSSVTVRSIVAALLGAGVAHAQNAPAPAGDSDSALTEVIVTASRREESVQKSSLSLEVMSGDQLKAAGVGSPIQLQNLVPGLTMSVSGATVVTYLRGVGSLSTDANAESAIAYNINGVYIARPNGIGPIFYDLERTEVVKGPQGTLYGRNATGGAINLITRRPGKEFGGDFSVDLGDFSYRRFQGAVNVPLSDTFALRAAGQITRRDGYLSDGYNDDDSAAGRLSALWNASEDLSLLVVGEYSHIGGVGAGVVKRSDLRPEPSDPWHGATEPDSQPPTAAIPGGTVLGQDGNTDVDIKAISAELNWDLGPATLTFIPAYRDTTPKYLTYTPGFRFDTAETSKEQSYELRLSNESDRVKWVTGLYYFNEDQTQHYVLQAIPIQQSQVDTTLGTKSKAIFGEATFSVTDAFRLIGGLRYSKDEKEQGGATITTLPRPGVVSNDAQRDFSNTSWKVGAELDVAAQSMLYATVATGYKAGGFFPSVPAPNNSFAPEKLTAFTLGSRNRFLDQRLQLNAEAFYWDYKDKQERFLGVSNGGATGLLTTNAGAAKLYGLNLDLQFKPTAADSVRANVEYLHTRYDTFQYTAYNSPPFGMSVGYSPSATGCKLGPIIPLTANDPFVPTDSLQTLDCSGKPLVNAPKWSGNAGYAHTFGLANGGSVVADASGQFASSKYLTADFINSGSDDGYVTWDASLTYHAPSDKWDVGAWGRNLNNAAIYTGGFRYPFSSPVTVGGDPTLYYAQIRAPRTYGVRGSVRF